MGQKILSALKFAIALAKLFNRFWLSDAARPPPDSPCLEDTEKSHGDEPRTL